MQTSQKIEVISYNPAWPEFFKQEAHRIQQALGQSFKEIYHIGSTAIPNMSAKPRNVAYSENSN